MTSETKTAAAVTGVGTVLMALAAGQFLMALDSSAPWGNDREGALCRPLRNLLAGIPP